MLGGEVLGRPPRPGCTGEKWRAGEREVGAGAAERVGLAPSGVCTVSSATEPTTTITSRFSLLITSRLPGDANRRAGRPPTPRRYMRSGALTPISSSPRRRTIWVARTSPSRACISSGSSPTTR